jgi:hypothetical protein
MAAGPAVEMWSKTTGSTESPDGRTVIVNRSRAFTCTLSPSDPIDIANTAPGLPLVNSIYPGTFFVVCRKLTITRLAPALAMIVADYSGEVGPNESGSPIDSEVVITWRGAITDEAIDQDINGKPIVTQCGEPIDGITERIPDMVATIERNFITINVPAISAYLKSRSSDQFLGWPAGTARLMEWSASNVFVNGVAGFWKVSATIQFREPYNTTPAKAWYKRVRHEGLMVRATAGAQPQPAFDLKTKSIATRPILLKQDGTRETNPENAFWLEFETTRALPYSALGLV